MRVTEVGAHGFSFPSGHATLAAAGYGALAVVVVRQYPRRLVRVAVWTAAVAAAAAVGFARLYLGVHWMTDVLAGWLLAAICLMLLFTSMRRLGPTLRERGSPPAVATPTNPRQFGANSTGNPLETGRS